MLEVYKPQFEAAFSIIHRFGVVFLVMFSTILFFISLLESSILTVLNLYELGILFHIFYLGVPLLLKGQKLTVSFY
jgi:succinate dehydrogenase/fumarate reductase cytochrome b subunit